MIPRNLGKRQDEVKLMMAPMVDIVFLLLIFFIMTFKIVAPEGNFNIRMPLSAPSEGRPDELQLPPIRIRLTADTSGNLAGIYFGESRMANFRQLQKEIISIIGDDFGPGSLAEETEVELDCDANLKFRHTIDAITAVSGDIRDGQIVKLIEKIKLTPPPQ